MFIYNWYFKKYITIFDNSIIFCFSDAGIESKFSNTDYLNAGGKITDSNGIYNSDIILKVDLTYSMKTFLTMIC